MGNFSGGSAYAMVQQISEGYVLVTERTFRRLSVGELDKLRFELEKLLRTIRAEVHPEDNQEIQKRNRRLQRLNQTRMMLQAFRQAHRR